MDAAAHQATLTAGGRTFAVMGTGIAAPVYPAGNRLLAGAIIDAGGALRWRRRVARSMVAVTKVATSPWSKWPMVRPVQSMMVAWPPKKSMRCLSARV
ncbi:hypothetical protein [Streptomyces sp. NPDC005004]